MNAKNQEQLNAIRELASHIDRAEVELAKLLDTAFNPRNVYVVAWDDGVNAFRTNNAGVIAMTGDRVWTSADAREAVRVAKQLTAKSREAGADRQGVIAITLQDYAANRRKWFAEMREHFAKAQSA